jgi:hypothetical protein
MHDLARLTDALITDIEWLKPVQRSILKDLCEACRQGDPDLIRTITDVRLRPTTMAKIQKLDEEIARLEEQIARERAERQRTLVTVYE